MIITASGSNGFNPAPPKPLKILLSAMEESKAGLKHGTTPIFVMWLMWLCIRLSLGSPYALLYGTKQPTSSGCSR